MAKEESKFNIKQFQVAKEIRDQVGNYQTIVISPIGDPTFIPKPRTFDQIKIVTDSLTAPTARRLYFYSFELQDWLYVSLST